MRGCKISGMAALLATIAGCGGGYTYSTTTYVPTPVPSETAVAVAPPAPIPEAPPPRPYYGAIWQSGYWRWSPTTAQYAWSPGRWTAPPRPGVVYLPPHWERNGSGWILMEGRWVTGQAYDRYGRHVWYDNKGRPHYL
jgi:hypothetical protein